jgi:hypothetical protein
MIAGCGGGSNPTGKSDAGTSDGGGGGAHAEITRCYLSPEGLPEAEVKLEGADDPHNPTYVATVAFRLPDGTDDTYLVNLTTFSDTAQGTTEVTSLEPILEGQSPSCLLTELHHDLFVHGEETAESLWTGEGPELELEP